MKEGSLVLAQDHGYSWLILTAIIAIAIVVYPFIRIEANPFLMLTASNFYQENLLDGKWMEGYLSSRVIQTNEDASDLTVSISSDSDKTLPANLITFQVTCENRSDNPAENVKFGLSFPKQISYLLDTSGASPGQNAAGLTWELGTINAKERKTFTITMVSGKPNPAGGQLLTITAFIKSGSLEINTIDNKSSRDIFLFPMSDMANETYPNTKLTKDYNSKPYESQPAKITTTNHLPAWIFV